MIRRLALAAAAVGFVAVVGPAGANTPAPKASTHANPAGPPPGAMSCSGCHPPNALIGTPVPDISSRSAEDIVALMRAFRRGERPATIMDRIATEFSDAEIEAIAAWLAARH